VTTATPFGFKILCISVTHVRRFASHICSNTSDAIKVSIELSEASNFHESSPRYVFTFLSEILAMFFRPTEERSCTLTLYPDFKSLIERYPFHDHNSKVSPWFLVYFLTIENTLSSLD
jgi:hypothetical protein